MKHHSCRLSRLLFPDPRQIRILTVLPHAEVVVRLEKTLVRSPLNSIAKFRFDGAIRGSGFQIARGKAFNFPFLRPEYRGRFVSHSDTCELVGTFELHTRAEAHQLFRFHIFAIASDRCLPIGRDPFFGVGLPIGSDASGWSWHHVVEYRLPGGRDNGTPTPLRDIWKSFYKAESSTPRPENTVLSRDGSPSGDAKVIR